MRKEIMPNHLEQQYNMSNIFRAICPMIDHKASNILVGVNCAKLKEMLYALTGHFKMSINSSESCGTPNSNLEIVLSRDIKSNKAKHFMLQRILFEKIV